MNLKRTVRNIALTLASIPTIALAAENNYKASLSHSIDNESSLNLGVELIIPKDAFLTPFYDMGLEGATATWDIGVGIKPEEADNFCPYLVVGISSQGLMSSMPTQYSGQFKVGLEKYLENSNILFLEYQQRDFKEDLIDGGKYKHNKKVSAGIKVSF